MNTAIHVGSAAFCGMMLMIRLLRHRYTRIRPSNGFGAAAILLWANLIVVLMPHLMPVPAEMASQMTLSMGLFAWAMILSAFGVYMHPLVKLEDIRTPGKPRRDCIAALLMEVGFGCVAVAVLILAYRIRWAAF